MLSNCPVWRVSAVTIETPTNVWMWATACWRPNAPNGPSPWELPWSAVTHVMLTAAVAPRVPKRSAAQIKIGPSAYSVGTL